MIASDELMDAVAERIERFGMLHTPDYRFHRDATVELAGEIARMFGVATECPCGTCAPDCPACLAPCASCVWCGCECAECGTASPVRDAQAPCGACNAPAV
jgi:hypothetical protein